MTPILSQPIKRRRRRKLPPGTLRVCLHDEAPKIGSGWRLVTLVSLGPKWAKLYDPIGDVGVRLPRAVWISISKRARPL
jgi:hypothetical protein